MYYPTLINIVLVATTFTAQVDDANNHERIARLIERLGDNSYATREAAEAEMFNVGETALPQLHVAARSNSDVEIRARAIHAIERIMVALCESSTLGMTFAHVKAGKFLMGSQVTEKERREDEDQHVVELKRPFLIGAHEVTQDEYAEVMEQRPSWFSPTGEGAEKVANLETGRFPVDSVTWFDAIVFCNRLSELDGYQPYYSITDIKFEDSSRISASVEIVGGTGYRLPTEAEWEYACRAGSTTPYHFEDSNRGGNFNHRSQTSYGVATRNPRRSTTVGSYNSNAWDIYDMHGNVAEWCWDWYDKSYYANSSTVDPSGPESGDHRVLRGGSWLVGQASCRSASRFWNVPGQGDMHIGFRIARTPLYEFEHPDSPPK